MEWYESVSYTLFINIAVITLHFLVIWKFLNNKISFPLILINKWGCLRTQLHKKYCRTEKNALPLHRQKEQKP